MKKPVIALLVLCVVLVVVFYGILSKPTAIESVIPSNAVVFVKVSDVDKQVKDLEASKLWKNIKNIDIEMLMEKSGVQKEQIDNFKTTKAELSGFFGGLVLDKYFGKEIALAIYPSQVKDASPEAFLEGVSGVTLITRVKPEANFIDLISKVFNKVGKKYDVSEENYNGKKITVIKVDDKVSLAYVKIKDLMVIGIGKKAAISCCDVADKKAVSLAQDKNYIAAMSKFPKGADVVAYGNMELVVSGLRQFANSVMKSFKGEQGTQQQAADNMNKAFDMYSGFKTLTYARYPGKVVKERFVLNIDKPKLMPFFKDFYSMAPRKSAALKLAPEKTIYYAWETYDFKSYWNYMKSELEKNTGTAEAIPAFTLKDMISGFEKQTGMSIDNDIIPALGDEAGFFLTDINLDGMIPIPEFAFFVKVKQKNTLEKLMSPLFQGGKPENRSESYKGVDIKYIALPFGLTIQPAYCYVGDYMIVSIGLSPLKASVDSYAGASKSLADSEDFKSVNQGLTEPNNGVLFIKTDVLFQKAKGICDWGIRWIAFMSEQEKKFKQTMESRAGKLKADIEAAAKNIAILKAQQANPSLAVEDAKKLSADIESGEAMIAANRQELDQYQEMMAQKQRSSLSDIDTSLVQLYLDKAVYPILDGLQSLKAVGLKTIYTENALETETFSKIVE